MSSISPPANDAQPPSSTSHAPQKPPAPELPQQTTSAHGLLSPWSSTVSSRVPSPLQDNPNTDNPDEPAPPSKPKDQQSRVDGGGALSLDSVHPDESVGDLFAGLDDEDSDERDGDDDDEEEEDDKEDKEDKDPESEDEEHWLDVASVNAEAVDFSGIIPARNRPKEKKATGYRAAQKVRKQSNEDLDEAVAEFERRARARAKKFAERAAKKFDKRVTEVESKMAGAKQWHKTRGINLANAKTSWYMKGVNATNKKPITLPRAQRRISKNPKLVEMTPEQEAQLVEVLQAQRDLKATGSRGTALGEGRDYLETVKQVSTELSNVAARTNAAVLLVISPTQPGAIGEPVALGINGGAEFALVKFKKSEVVLAHEFRAFVENLSPGSLQARIRGMKTADVAERARQHIKDGLDNIVGHATRMFYTPAYFKTIVQGHGVYLHGYPVGVPWASPKEFTSRPVTEKLLTALESGACSWRKVKNAGHEEKIKKDWEELTGSVAECAPRKRRNDVGGTHERKRGTGKRGRDGNGDETEAEETVAQRRNKRKQRSKATIEDEDEDEQEDEDVTPPRKKAKSSARVHDTDDDDDDDVNPPRKKAKEPKSSAQVHNTDDEEDEGVNETVKAKRKGGMVDGKRPAKKVKKSKEGDEEVKTKRKGGEVDPKGPTEKVKKTKEPKKKNTVKGSRRGPPGVRDG